MIINRRSKEGQERVYRSCRGFQVEWPVNNRIFMFMSLNSISFDNRYLNI
jgi:hypothetical protein